MPNYIRQTGSGGYQFVRDHHKHHRPRKCFAECAGRSCWEWEDVVRQLNTVIDANSTMVSENGALKNEVHTLKSELHTYRNADQAWRHEYEKVRVDNHTLSNENIALKHRLRELEKEHEHSGHFKRRIRDQEREIGVLRGENHDLQNANDTLKNKLSKAHDMVERWKFDAIKWKRQWESELTRNDRLAADMGTKDRLIVEQSDKIHRLQYLFRRGW